MRDNRQIADAMLIHDHVSIQMLEPGAPHARPRFIQDRDFFTFRNTRQLLLHTPAACPTHGIPIESYPMLRGYHVADHLYTLQFRNTYNVKTYATFLGIVNDPAEPFVSASNMLDYRTYSLHALPAAASASAARAAWDAVAVKAGVAKPPTPTKLLFDCVAHNPAADAAAVVTSTPTALTVPFMQELLHQCHFAYFYCRTGHDEAFCKRWAPLFSTRDRAVRLYIGVGGNEYGEVAATTRVATPALADAHPLAALGRTAARSAAAELHRTPQTAAFQQAVQALVPPEARVFATQHGIRLLVRCNLRYFMLR